MTDQEAINFILSNNYQIIKGKTSFSSFWGALKDARKMTKRDQITGKINESDKYGDTGSWLGTIGYLILLDQIGKCYKKKDGPPQQPTTPELLKALTNFTKVEEKERDAIYALRCSFAHEYALDNVGRRPSLTHQFRVFDSPEDWIVKLPQIEWNGKQEDKNEKNKTHINLRAIGQLVEDVFVTLVHLNLTCKLEIALPGGWNELILKYSFYEYKKK